MPDYISYPIRGGFVKIDPESLPLIKSLDWFVHHRYAVARKPGKSYQFVYMHRLIMNARKNRDVHHINGDRVDNRRSNLAIMPRKDNLRLRGG